MKIGDKIKFSVVIVDNYCQEEKPAIFYEDYECKKEGKIIGIKKIIVEGKIIAEKEIKTRYSKEQEERNEWYHTDKLYHIEYKFDNPFIQRKHERKIWILENQLKELIIE